MRDSRCASGLGELYAARRGRRSGLRHYRHRRQRDLALASQRRGRCSCLIVGFGRKRCLFVGLLFHRILIRRCYLALPRCRLGLVGRVRLLFRAGRRRRFVLRTVRGHGRIWSVILRRRRRVVLSAAPIQGFPRACILVAELVNRLQDLDLRRLGLLHWPRWQAAEAAFLPFVPAVLHLRFGWLFHLRLRWFFRLRLFRGRRRDRFRLWLIGRRHEGDAHRLLLLHLQGRHRQPIDQERGQKRMKNHRCGQPPHPSPDLSLVFHPNRCGVK